MQSIPHMLMWSPIDPPTKWSAVWITAENVLTRPNACFRVRRRVELAQPPASFVVHVSAESSYRLYVNGQFVERGPVRGTATLAFYDSYDIASLLRPGENWIAADVHCHNLPTSQAVPVSPGFFLQGQDGVIATDASWQAQPADEWRSDVPIFTYQVGYMEWFDRRGEPDGWRVGRDGSTWQQAVILTIDEQIGNKRLLSRDVPALREAVVIPVDVRAIATTPALDSADDVEVARRMTTEAHRPLARPIDFTTLLLSEGGPVVIEPPSDGGGLAILADFVDVVNGRLEVDIDAPPGTILDVGYEEEAIGGRLLLTAWVYRFADRYILRDGRQTAGNAFAARGFRIVQLVLRNFDRPVHIHAIRGVQRRYPYPRGGAFTCSNALINTIWDASVETMSACTTDTLVDCPWRENTLWFNDMLVENVTSLQAFGDPRLNERCFRLAVSQPRPNGLLPGAVPAGLMPGMDDLEASIDSIVLLATNLFFANMLEEHYAYTGNEAFIREMLPSLHRIHRTFDEWEDAEGMIQPRKPYWNFIDWSYPHPPEAGKENEAVLNWFRVWSLVATARLLAQLDGNNAESERLAAKASRIGVAVDQRFWNPDRGCYVECAAAPTGLATQLSHAVALLSGQVPSHRKAAVIAALDRDDLLTPELYMQHLVFRAFVRFGDPQCALNRIRKYWGPIVMGGSPTIGELGVHQPHAKSSFGGAASLCHGFSTTPIDLLQTVVLGVAPTAPGFKRCRIRPNVFDFDHARGRVPTPLGNMRVAWQRLGSRSISVTLSVPIGMTVECGEHRELGAGDHSVELPIR